MESDLIRASSGGSMSDYGSDLEDIEVELLRDKTRTHVIIRDTDRNNHYRFNLHKTRRIVFLVAIKQAKGEKWIVNE